MNERKPVVHVTPEKMWDYKYQAKRASGEDVEILASDSLGKLKREVRRCGWGLAWLTTTKGAFSYGQSVVDEYPYCPRY